MLHRILSAKMASPQVRSLGVVIFKLSSLPWVRQTGKPMRSTAEQSSVRTAPSSKAWAKAPWMRPISKTWGVWTNKM